MEEAKTISEWVLAARKGSNEAFDALHRCFTPLVYGLLLSRYRAAVAEELTQECFLIAFRRLDQLRQPQAFGAWIAAIARRMKTRATREDSDDACDAESRQTSLEDVLDAQTVLDAIRRLPEAYRDTLMLRLVEGMSGPEIAAATGLDAGSVRVNLHRGMRKLRDALGITTGEADHDA